ncbi:MAG: hypothetical protein V4456_22725, partial [Bacteroidota bacterium]
MEQKHHRQNTIFLVFLPPYFGLSSAFLGFIVSTISKEQLLIKMLIYIYLSIQSLFHSVPFCSIWNRGLSCPELSLHKSKLNEEEH